MVTDILGSVGIARREHPGMYVVVEHDASRSGYHIWLSPGHPTSGPSPGWDIWADDEDQVMQWVADLAVEWLACPPGEATNHGRGPGHAVPAGDTATPHRRGRTTARLRGGRLMLWNLRVAVAALAVVGCIMTFVTVIEGVRGVKPWGAAVGAVACLTVSYVWTCRVVVRLSVEGQGMRWWTLVRRHSATTDSVEFVDGDWPAPIARVRHLGRTWVMAPGITGVAEVERAWRDSRHG